MSVIDMIIKCGSVGIKYVNFSDVKVICGVVHSANIGEIPDIKGINEYSNIKFGNETITNIEVLKFKKTSEESVRLYVDIANIQGIPTEYYNVL